MNNKDIIKLDESGMYEIYDKWPDIAYRSYHSVEPIQYHGINHIVFAGMGGSGTIGDLLSAVLSKTDIHTTIIKGYLLPNTINDKTLVVCSSVSGNTTETITIANTAHKSNCKMICFSSGGKLEEFCKKHSITFRNVESFCNPRSSFTSYAYTIIKSLESILPIEKKDVQESLQSLQNISHKINTKNLTHSNPSLELAKWMNDIPMIYYPWGLQAAAIRFKNSIQENMKIHAMAEDVMEASHNGIVSWQNSSPVIPIIIRGKNDHTRTIERWKVLKEFFISKDIDYKEIHSINGNILSKITSMIYQLDMSTIYGAVLNGIDPGPVQAIDFIKKKTATN